MNKNAIGIALAVVIIGVGGFFALAMNKDEAANEETEDNTSMQMDALPSGSGSGAAGTSLAGSPGSEQNDTPMMNSMDPDDQSSNYSIDMRNFEYSISQIKAKPGESIVIELTNSGGTHDFVIDELGVQSDTITTGGNALVSFTVPEDASGKTFEYYCSIGNHRAQGMVGTLTVQ